MREPKPTTLTRMREAAYERMRTIEMSEDARVAAGDRRVPLPELELLRDDFAGLFRLVDAVISDQDLAENIARRMRR